MDVFITDIAAFLPNEPVGNDQVEEVLGLLDGKPSVTKNTVLRSNRIQLRHYAIDPKTGRATHTTAQLAAEAIRRLAPYEGFTPADIECLCCGSATPDLLMPGHGLMVHGELGTGPCEVLTTAGICLSGMTAMKYAYLNVAQGISRNAVATAAEAASSFLRAELCAAAMYPTGVQERRRRSAVGFDMDFLRFMLSDGAGAAYLTADRPHRSPALRIEWIEHLSFAGQMDTCMWAGALKSRDGHLTSWRELGSLSGELAPEALVMRQDMRLLNREVVVTAVDKTLAPLVAKRGLSADDIRWFLPHYSSEYFREPLAEHLRGIGFEIPQERWFSNLKTKGNTGSASIYIMLEEFLRSGRPQPGDRILCFVPESGRFSNCYTLLSVL